MKRDDLLHIFQEIDRSYFIDNEYKDWAYYDRPLPIDFGQTISQPSIVLEMTEQLTLDKNSKVLEIGTGSGYQTAFLAQCAGAVYTVERIPELSQKAQQRLASLGYSNIHYRVGDGSEGWSEFAPYDRIITTAAAEKIPEKLVKQLKLEGIMIAPIGPKGYQDLFKITKDKNGTIQSKSLGKVTFVEMKGEYGWGVNEKPPH